MKHESLMKTHSIVLHEACFSMSYEEMVVSGCGQLRLRFCNNVIADGHKDLLDLVVSVFTQTYNIVLHATSFDML